jgi:hypothetical protein
MPNVSLLFRYIGLEFSPDRSGSQGILLALLVAVLLVLPLSSIAQTTQTVSLDAGWNLVSLHVQPDDPSFASIFGGTGSSVSVVKNENGEVYLPGQGIEQISTWRISEGYSLYAETATVLDVTGPGASPETTTIELQKGGNIIPYLPAGALAVEEALVSIEESLVAVEDEDGRQYNPSASSTTLDSLRPGQGYEVYVDQADTLRYPKVAKTLDDALAFTSIPVGSYVRVQGYYEPGDDGGGVFQVTESGAETDGGTVFAFDEDVSSEQSEQLTDAVRGRVLSDSDLRWGTVEVEINGTTNQRIVDTEFLHGHTVAGWVSNGQHVPMIDYRTGAFADRTILQTANDQLNGDNTFTARYKYLTSDRRLERIGVTNAVNIDWWGAKEADPQNPVNNWWRINWAINKAKEIYENSGYDWTYVDIPGHYYYRYLIRIQNGVRLRGTSNQTFAPAANGEPTYGKLEIMPGLAMNHQKDGFDQDHLHGYLKTAQIDLTHAQGIHRFGAKSLELDGNRENNLAPIEDPNDLYTGVRGKLLSGENWNGMAGKGSNSGAWNPADDAVGLLEDIYIHDFPGNGLVPNGIDWTGTKNVRVENAFRNHQFYLRETVGHIDKAQIEGWGWGSLIKVTKGKYTDIDITPAPNPIKERFPDNWADMDWEKVWDHHGKGFGLEWIGDSERIATMTIDVDNFSVDMSNTNNTTPNQVIADRGYGGEYTNGTVLSDPGNQTTLLKAVGASGPIRDYTYENITVTNQGGGVYLFNGTASATHITAKDITLKAAGDVSGPDGAKFFKLIMHNDFTENNGENKVPLSMAGRMELINVKTQQPRSASIFKVGPKDNAHPYNFFVLDSKIDNTDAGYRSKNLLFDGTRDSQQILAEKARMMLSNTTFNVYSPPPEYREAKFHTYVLNDEKTIRLRNCTSIGGRESDESGTYTSTASDEGNNYVLIPTSLMTLSQETDVTVTSGSRTVQSVENADSGGNVLTFDPANPQAFDPRDPYLRVNLDAPIQSGSTITLDWTARVTPTEDYQTTGVFIARPVANKTYASGGGPFTVDLRGVAASQETQDPVQYSASSDDTSVVTANVNEILSSTRTNVPWELELTEQGTGTATVTVNATINGIGTATDTFEVTVK